MSYALKMKNTSSKDSSATELVNEEIDALRAVAVIFVLLHHYQTLLDKLPLDWYGYVEGLWSGVDLFFCISGFVITRSLIPRIQDKYGLDFWREVTSFWIRRSYRILPSSWLWIFITLFSVSIYSGGNFDAIKINFGDGLSAFLQVANFHFFQCTLDVGRRCGIMSIYWSLSLEEQFYICLPLLVFIFRKRLIILLIFALLIQLFLVRNQWQGISSFIRTDAVIAGLLLARFTTKSEYKLMEPVGLSNPVSSWLLAVVLISAIGFVAQLKLVSFHMGLVAILCGVVVWIASYGRGYLFPEGIVRIIMVKIGRRSFSIYLTHILSFFLAKHVARNYVTDNVMYSTLITLSIGILILCIAVEVNFRLIEVRFRRYGRDISLKFNEKWLRVNTVADSV